MSLRTSTLLLFCDIEKSRIHDYDDNEYDEADMEDDIV